MAKKKLKRRARAIRKSTKDGLSDKEQVFLAAYLSDFNGKEAAMKAGYAASSATLNATRILARPNVQKALKAEVQNRIYNMELDAKTVVGHLQTALFLDPIEVFEEKSPGIYIVKSLMKIPKPIRQCITKMRNKVREIPTKTGDIIKETYTEVEFLSKEQAMNMAMRYLGLLVEKKEVNNTVVNINWDKLINPDTDPQAEQEDDVIEGRIKALTEEESNSG